MGDIKFQSLTVLDCENYLPKTSAKGADGCHVKACFASQHDPSYSRCVDFRPQAEGFVPLMEKNRAILEEFRQRDPGFRVRSEQLAQGIFLDQIFTRSGLKGLKISTPESEGVRIEVDSILLNNLLTMQLFSPDQSYQAKQGEWLQTLNRIHSQQPTFKKIWQASFREIQGSSHFPPAIKERAQWIHAAMDSFEKLLSPFEKILIHHPSLRPTLETVVQQWVEFLFMGGEIQQLASPELFHAIEEFYHTQALPPPEIDELSDGFFDPLNSGFYQIVETPLKASAWKKPVLAQQQHLEDFLTKPYRQKWSRLTLLADSHPEQAFQESLILVYGDNPIRKRMVELLIAHSRVEGFSKAAPSYSIDMESLAQDIYRMATETQSTEVKAEVASFLVRFFDPEANLEVFWQGRYRKVPGFHSVLEFGPNRTRWSELIYWIRAQQPEGNLPHYPVRKLGLYSDMGLGLLGAGLLATGYGTESPGLEVLGWGLLGSGLGGAAANLTCYALDLANYYFLCDLLGAIGLGLGGVTLGLNFASESDSAPSPMTMGENNSVEPPVNNSPNNNDHRNPNQRYPTDPFGP